MGEGETQCVKSSQGWAVVIFNAAGNTFGATQRICELLLIVNSCIIHFLIGGIGEADLVAVLERNVCIRLFVFKPYLLAVARDQPQSQFVVTAGKIIVGEFEAIIEAFGPEILFGPFTEIPIDRFYVRDGKNIPAFFVR